MKGPECSAKQYEFYSVVNVTTTKVFKEEWNGALKGDPSSYYLTLLINVARV